MRTWDNIQKEMKGVMLNTFSLAKLKYYLLIMYKTPKIFYYYNFFFSKVILYSLPFLQILSNDGHSKLRIDLRMVIISSI